MVVTHMEWKAMVSSLAALLALKRTDTQRGADDSAQTLLGGLSRWAGQGAQNLPLTKLPAVPPPISSRPSTSPAMPPPR